MRRSNLPENMLAELRHSLRLLTAQSSLSVFTLEHRCLWDRQAATVGMRVGQQGGGRGIPRVGLCSPSLAGVEGPGWKWQDCSEQEPVPGVRRLGGGDRAELPGLREKAWGPEALGGFTPSWGGGSPLPLPPACRGIPWLLLEQGLRAEDPGGVGLR